MRFISKWLVVGVTAMSVVAGGFESANAGFVGMPSMLGQMVKRISFGSYTLPPMAFTRFCMRYADQCKPSRMLFRGGPVRMTEERWDDLKQVNETVNGSIVPEPNTEGVLAERWVINPSSGDCNDYAVSKRYELLKRGWPARALLLSEVKTAWGEGHLVLVVRTSAGDLVLDNLTAQIRSWAKAPYRWVKMQTSKNPNFWASVSMHSV